MNPFNIKPQTAAAVAHQLDHVVDMFLQHRQHDNARLASQISEGLWTIALGEDDSTNAGA